MKRYNQVEFSALVCEVCALGMMASAVCLILDAIHKYVVL